MKLKPHLTTLSVLRTTLEVWSTEGLFTLATISGQECSAVTELLPGFMPSEEQRRQEQQCHNYLSSLQLLKQPADLSMSVLLVLASLAVCLYHNPIEHRAYILQQ